MEQEPPQPSSPLGLATYLLSHQSGGPLQHLSPAAFLRLVNCGHFTDDRLMCLHKLRPLDMAGDRDTREEGSGTWMKGWTSGEKRGGNPGLCEWTMSPRFQQETVDEVQSISKLCRNLLLQQSRKKFTFLRCAFGPLPGGQTAALVVSETCKGHFTGQMFPTKKDIVKLAPCFKAPPPSQSRGQRKQNY